MKLKRFTALSNSYLEKTETQKNISLTKITDNGIILYKGEKIWNL